MSDDKRLSDEERMRRSGSFGDAADAYERFRPGPPAVLIDWLLENGPSVLLDLGAGTGALTRDLVDRVERVIAVEPDDRMRQVLSRLLPAVMALDGTGEAIPLEDASVDAVLAASSWHWMDPVQALAECARVLRRGGTLAAVWTGPDPDGLFLSNAQSLMREMSGTADGVTGGDSDLAETITDAPNRVEMVLRVPADGPFSQPEQAVESWDVALTADELIGLLGTFSWIITLDDEKRERVFGEARRVLRDGLGIHGDATVDVQYRSEAWRCHRL